MRLGKYSGRIYEENEMHTMEECGVFITDEQAKMKIGYQNIMLVI